MISYEIAQYLQPATDLVVLALSFAAFQKWQSLDANKLLTQNWTSPTIITVVFTLYSILIGFRPPSGILFGDSANYAMLYGWNNLGNIDQWINNGEWLFYLIQSVCYEYFEVSIFFTVIMLGYMFIALKGIKRLFKNNTYGALLFYIGAFSFFSYATNGIRNGLACSIAILAMSYVAFPKKNYLVFALLCMAAYSIHRSTILPIACMIASLFIKSTRPIITFWVISIFLSIVAKGPIESFFSGLGFDDRLSGYINSAEDYAELGYKSGFRPDFLLYSFMPILLGMFVNSKLSRPDSTYNFLLNTYTLSNSFWDMLMNAAFSNRFAYLSWFMYPIVLAYPCLRMNVWRKKQGATAGIILLIHTLFTVFMVLFY